MSYATVLQLVEQTVTQGDGAIREDVSSFLRQYSTTLRRRVVPDTTSNARAMARKIYMEHREANRLYQRQQAQLRRGREIYRQGRDRPA